MISREQRPRRSLEARAVADHLVGLIYYAATKWAIALLHERSLRPRRRLTWRRRGLAPVFVCEFPEALVQRLSNPSVSAGRSDTRHNRGLEAELFLVASFLATGCG